MVILPENFCIEKYNTFLRLVIEEDAEFILKLRTDDRINKYVSFVENNVEKQKIWIKKYKQRESEGIEYYFLVGDNSRKFYGTTRLYNFGNNTFETGSWIFLKDTPEGLAIKGDIIGREIAFDILGFDYCTFNVRKKNKKVILYHLSYDPKIINEDEQNIYFTIDKETFNKNKIKYLKFFGYEF